ncbi:hypothetical protein HKX48_002726, partial [Thoreauomyces humboldtii]
LSTVQHADLIIVVDQGRVVQQGTHVTLMAEREGKYASMVAEQSLAAAAVASEAMDE